MKNCRLLRNAFSVLIILLFGAGVCFAQGAASPSTPEEKQEQDKAKKDKTAEKAPLELTEPVVVSPTDAEKSEPEEAVKPAENGEAAEEVKEGESQENKQEAENDIPAKKAPAAAPDKK